ncbi:MAG: hypothetical protein IPP93_09350 [Chitinophagaceae bacterium]|nr:hypothetical protein [Chitinophagaceae bacterium]
MKKSARNTPKDQTQPQDKTRRLLLKMMGLGAGITAAKPLPLSGKGLEEMSAWLGDEVNITLFRPDDLLELELKFTGFQKTPDSRGLRKTGSPNFLYVVFHPQSLVEQAFEEGSAAGEMNFTNKNDASVKGNEKASLSNEVMSFPAKTYLSGRSRLVFEIPANINSIPLTAAALLDWDRYKPVINRRAPAPKTTPVFNVDDINSGDFKNILIKDIKENGINIETKPVNNIRTNNPVNNDTLRRVQLNRNVRAATRDEQKVIENRELPPAAVRVTEQPGIKATIEKLRYGRTPRPVDADETSIEMPYRLFISPHEYAVWYHEHQLKLREDLQGTVLKTFELWHSRMTCKNCDDLKDHSGALNAMKTVRALWATDISGNYKEKPTRSNTFKTALYNDDRHCIVHESSNWALPNNFVPQPVQVTNLMLSTLGAWLDAEMLVKRDSLEKSGLLGSLNLLKWKHIATLARDHYVEVVYAGNMFPFGHEASLVRITERKPQQGYAVNRQRYFIVINEEEKKFNPYNSQNGSFNSFHFSTIRFVTTATPTIEPPHAFFAGLDDHQDDHQFIPVVSGKPFLFKLIGFDLDGNETDFEMPLVFITTDICYTTEGALNYTRLDALSKYYNKNIAGMCSVNFRNQNMALARSSTAGDTHFQVNTILFNAHTTQGEKPGFGPVCKELEIFISAVENITGKRTAQKVSLVDDEMNKAESARKNKGKVFAKLIGSQAVNFNGSGNKTGGSLSPNFSITGLSKSLGAIGGDVDKAMNAYFDPSSFFDSGAKLFGVIELGKIIKVASNAVAAINGESIQSPFPALKNTETKDAHITQYSWTAASLQPFDFGFVKFKPESGAAGKVQVETKLYRYKDPSKQNALVVQSHIDDFAVEVAGIAAIRFKRVGFNTGIGSKTDFTVDMADQPFRFLGALTFVNDLQRYIPADGFSDPPYLDITTSGIRAGYTLGLPDIQLGIFTLRNINLGAEVRLPFDGSPLSLRFNFCEKQQPFNLTVSALGGGGFFAVEFDMKGLRSLEAALEFGASVSLNLGVASGSVSIMGGIYFKMSVTDGVNSYELQGYVRVNGALSVLGLITVSVEFLLTLTAELTKVAGEDKVARVWGEASLKVKIEIFMFSKTVSMKVQKEFAGAGADPTFTMMISDRDWEQYCDSFAA